MKDKQSKFALRTISMKEAKDVLRNLKPKMSSALTGVPKKLIRNASEVLACLFQRIVNTSIRLATFPKAFKELLAVCVHKRDNKQNKENYRLISSIDPISTAFESTVNSQILNYLIENEL